MPYGWVARCRSGIARAMCHILKWFIHLLAHGLSKGDEPAAPALLMQYGILYLYMVTRTDNSSCNVVGCVACREDVK